MSFLNDLSAIGSNPNVRVLNLLHERSRRFTELLPNDTAGDEQTLSESLRELDSSGLIARHVEPGPPLRVLYNLTAAGARLAPTLTALAAWFKAIGGAAPPRAPRTPN